jgi:hypothetical protein
LALNFALEDGLVEEVTTLLDQGVETYLASQEAMHAG